MSDPLSLLFILAHPDDESLGMGSTIAKYSAEGVRVSLLCATRGERGWMGDEQDNPGPEELGRIREAELRQAAETLGIHQLYFLNYIDGDLDKADPDEVMAAIASILREACPHVAVTFGPDGAYGHPDHIAISQFSAGACALAADTGFIDSKRLPPHRTSKLYYFVNSAAFVQNYSRVFGDIQMDVDGTPRTSVHWPDWMFTTLIDGGEHWRTALKAVNCHKSQVAIYGSLNDLPDSQSEALWRTRSYYRVYSLVNGGRARETDLFEGLR